MLANRFPAEHGALLVVDIQTKLIKSVAEGELVVANTTRLIQAANALSLPVLATEQYPKGLGPTVDALLPLLPVRTAKTSFSAAAASGIAAPIQHVTLVGIETHVCILHTALDLLDAGFAVQVVHDAVSSRNEFDADIAIRRMAQAGATITTAEAALFEWVRGSDHPCFKTISKLIRDFEPPSILF